MKNNQLKLLIKDKYYREARLELLKIKIISLPVIKHVIGWYEAYKMCKQMKGMDNWEQYVTIKNKEVISQRYCFAMALLRLEVVIMANDIDEEMFYQAKKDVLSYDIINEPDLREFKQWLEAINQDETDYSKVQEVIDSFTIAK